MVQDIQKENRLDLVLQKQKNMSIAKEDFCEFRKGTLRSTT